MGIIQALRKEQAALQEDRDRALRQQAAELEAERAAKQTLEQQLSDAQVQYTEHVMLIGH